MRILVLLVALTSVAAAEPVCTGHWTGTLDFAGKAKKGKPTCPRSTSAYDVTVWSDAHGFHAKSPAGVTAVTGEWDETSCSARVTLASGLTLDLKNGERGPSSGGYLVTSDCEVSGVGDAELDAKPSPKPSLPPALQAVLGRYVIAAKWTADGTCKGIPTPASKLAFTVTRVGRERLRATNVSTSTFADSMYVRVNAENGLALTAFVADAHGDPKKFGFDGCCTTLINFDLSLHDKTAHYSLDGPSERCVYTGELKLLDRAR